MVASSAPSANATLRFLRGWAAEKSKLLDVERRRFDSQVEAIPTISKEAYPPK